LLFCEDKEQGTCCINSRKKSLNGNRRRRPFLTFVVEMRHISKSFPGIKANDDISLELKKAKFMLYWARMAQANPPLMSILFGLYVS
jgi:hypothetical protein